VSDIQHKHKFISVLRNIFLAKFNFEWSTQYDAAYQSKEDAYCTSRIPAELAGTKT